MDAGSTFTNNKAIKDNAIGAFDLEPYRKAVFAFSKTMQNIRDAVDSDKAWDNYPPFLEAMFESRKKPCLHKIHPSWDQATHGDFDQGNGSGDGSCGYDGRGRGGHGDGGSNSAGLGDAGRGGGGRTNAGRGSRGRGDIGDYTSGRGGRSAYHGDTDYNIRGGRNSYDGHGVWFTKET